MPAPARRRRERFLIPPRGGPAAAVLLAALLVLAGCRSDEPVETAGPELLGLNADQVLIGMEHHMTREGLRRAYVRADTARFLPDSSVVRLSPVEVTFYDEAGREVSELEAREGLYDMQSNDMEATGEVVVDSRQEFQRLETEHLVYDASADRLRSERRFVLYREDGVLRGTGFVSDPGLDTVRVQRPSAVSEQADAP